PARFRPFSWRTCRIIFPNVFNGCHWLPAAPRNMNATWNERKPTRVKCHRSHTEALGASAQMPWISCWCLQSRVMAKSTSRTPRTIQILIRIRAALPPVRLAPSSTRAGQKTSPQLRGTASSIQRSPYMSLRGDSYRQRADDAKHRAAQAKDLSIKSAFEHVAAVWAALAEQVDRIDREKFPPRDEENNRSVR